MYMYVYVYVSNTGYTKIRTTHTGTYKTYNTYNTYPSIQYIMAHRPIHEPLVDVEERTA